MKIVKMRSGIIILSSLVICLFLLFSSIIGFHFFTLGSINKNDTKNNDLNVSAVGGFTNLTNVELNNTQHYHGSQITIKGRLYKPDGTGIPNYVVFLFINGIISPYNSNTTDGSGNFEIKYVIPYDLDIFKSYELKVNVTSKINGNDIQPLNFYIIYVNATSYLKVKSYDMIPKAEGEGFNLDGYLKYDNQYGEGISNSLINFYWYNSSNRWSIGSFSTDTDGNFSETLPIPTNTFSDHLNLFLNFSTIPNQVKGSQLIIPNITIFPNISCIWSISSNVQERQQISISGEIVSSRNYGIKINDRGIRVYYNSTLIYATITNANGRFSFTYTIPVGTGIAEFNIQLVTTTQNLRLSNSTYIVVNKAPPIGSPDIPIPFFGFLIIFLPILIGVVALLLGYGFYYYKKNLSGKRTISVPLENKIINLKILKDSDRIEEAISYLFNAIYMELIEAKFGRIRKETETIKDFAIISVNEFKLSPSIIYPFIEKIEEFIYGRPFHAKLDDFYKACDSFSPVYKSLTGGHEFILNF